MGAHSGLHFHLTDEQPCFCAELRGPFIRQSEEGTRWRSRGFVGYGGLASAISRACSHSKKTRGKVEVGGERRGAVVALVYVALAAGEA